MLGRWWRQRREQRALQRRAMSDELWLATLRAHPFLARRPMIDLLRLREMSALFLDRKEFTAVGGLVLTDAIAASIALQACVPVLHLGLSWYDAFVGIVVQPDEVVAQRHWIDEHGIAHEGEELLAGEAMPGGPVMLSWPDVQLAGADASQPYNVVIHEFAHVIDMCDGREADGMPPLPSREAAAEWTRVMGDAHARLCAALEAGHPTVIDPYAANGLEEFFAVASEAFFVAPGPLHEAEPAVYQLLKTFFQQDPARYLR
ncbi:MAG: M90 family metallopeptidase [Burkholderiales bacterium]